MSITVDFYSEKAIVVRNTLEHHGPIMEQLGGTFNEKLRGGRGWIFSKFKMTQVRNIVDKLNSGQYGNEYEQKSATAAAPAVSSPSCVPVADMVSKAEFLSVVSRLERLEALVANLCHVNPLPYSSQLVQSSSQLKQHQHTPNRLVEEDDYDPLDEQDEPPVERKRLVAIHRK